MSDTSTNSIPLTQLEQSAAAKWESIGDKYIGRIVSIDHRQQTDPATGTPKVFASGDPMMLWVIVLQPDEGETVALWAKGGRFKLASGSGESMLNAIGAAVKNAGASSLDVGGRLAVAFSGLGEQKSAGFNPPKLFTAAYEAPKPQATSVPVDLFSQEQ
jgi:hypothetical protein